MNVRAMLFAMIGLTIALALGSLVVAAMAPQLAQPSRDAGAPQSGLSSPDESNGSAEFEESPPTEEGFENGGA